MSPRDSCACAITSVAVPFTLMGVWSSWAATSKGMGARTGQPSPLTLTRKASSAIAAAGFTASSRHCTRPPSRSNRPSRMSQGTGAVAGTGEPAGTCGAGVRKRLANRVRLSCPWASRETDKLGAFNSMAARSIRRASGSTRLSFTPRRSHDNRPPGLASAVRSTSFSPEIAASPESHSCGTSRCSKASLTSRFKIPASGLMGHAAGQYGK